MQEEDADAGEDGGASHALLGEASAIEVMDGLPPDLVADVMEHAEVQAGLAPDLAGADDLVAAPTTAGRAAQGHDEEPQEAESDEEAAKQSAMREADALEAGGAADESKTPAEAAANATTSPMGYVASPFTPWSAWAAQGRITTWPASKEMRLRSVSMRCYFHSSCQSPATRRSAVSDATLKLWLYSGDVQKGADSATQRALAARHKSLFADILKSAEEAEQAIANAAASSSQARSPS